MYAKGRREIKVICYALIVAALICVAGLLFSGGCSRIASPAGDNGGSTTQQIKRAAELNQQAGTAVKSAARAVGRAEQHADRAEQLNQSAQEGIDDCQNLIEQIRADNRRAKQILDELITSAQARATQDAAR